MEFITGLLIFLVFVGVMAWRVWNRGLQMRALVEDQRHRRHGGHGPGGDGETTTKNENA